MADLIADILDGLIGPESDVSPFDRAHLTDVLTDSKRYDNWTAHLWRLMVRADAQNETRLAMAFPKHYAALRDWRLNPPTPPAADHIADAGKAF